MANPYGAITVPGRRGGVEIAGTVPDPNRGAKMDLYLRTFADTGNATKAAELAGIPLGTLYAWLAHDPAFKVRYRETIRGLEGHVAATLYRRATDPTAGMAGNVAAFGWGKRFFPELWSERHIIVTQGAEGLDAAVQEFMAVAKELAASRRAGIEAPNEQRDGTTEDGS